MTNDEWLTSTDPATMINAACEHPRLWNFVVECCRRILPELQDERFRYVVDYVERAGTLDVEKYLGDAHDALEEMAARLTKTKDQQKADRLNRQIGLGQLVLAFDHQESGSAARYISYGLLEWADDPNLERRVQADLLRNIMPQLPKWPPPED